MISVDPTPGAKPPVRQDLYAPAVYFDHWAVRLFSDSSELADRFVAALHRARGTLLVSMQNLGEFSVADDRQHAKDAEQFLDRLLPHLVFADFGADVGYIHLHGRPGAEDDDWLASAIRALWKANGEKLTTVGLIADEEEDRQVVLAAFQDMKAGIANSVAQVKQMPERVAWARSGKHTPNATLRQLLHDELLRDFIAEPAVQFGANDATDFIHALGSTLACDMVLLDGRWVHKVAQADRKLKKAGVTHRLPPAYSKRDVPAFLAALETWPAPSGAQHPKPIPV